MVALLIDSLNLRQPDTADDLVEGADAPRDRKVGHPVSGGFEGAGDERRVKPIPKRRGLS